MDRKKAFYDIQWRISVNGNWCYIRQWAKNNSGYWVKKIDGKFWYTHRFIYDYLIGIDAGMVVDHRCKTPLCCNIQHLQLLNCKMIARGE